MSVAPILLLLVVAVPHIDFWRVNCDIMPLYCTSTNRGYWKRHFPGPLYDAVSAALMNKGPISEIYSDFFWGGEEDGTKSNHCKVFGTFVRGLPAGRPAALAKSLSNLQHKA